MSLLLVQVEEIDDLLLSLPAVVDAAERGDPDAAFQAREWLVNVEQAFERNRVADGTAAIAALRAELAMAVGGVLTPELRFTREPRSRRARLSAVLDVLRRAVLRIDAVLAPSRAQQQEADGLIRQLVAIARHKGVPGSAAPGPQDEAGVRALWREMSSDPDLTSGSVRILGLVGESDTVVLLDRALLP